MGTKPGRLLDAVVQLLTPQSALSLPPLQKRRASKKATRTKFIAFNGCLTENPSYNSLRRRE